MLPLSRRFGIAHAAAAALEWSKEAEELRMRVSESEARERDARGEAEKASGELWRAQAELRETLAKEAAGGRERDGLRLQVEQAEVDARAAALEWSKEEQKRRTCNK